MCQHSYLKFYNHNIKNCIDDASFAIVNIHLRLSLLQLKNLIRKVVL